MADGTVGARAIEGDREPVGVSGGGHPADVGTVSLTCDASGDNPSTETVSDIKILAVELNPA